MRIAYLEIRNLDSHERKAISYWIGGGVLIIMMIIIMITRMIMVMEKLNPTLPPIQ